MLISGDGSTGPRPDVAVVGAGIGGLLAATCLARRGRSVLLLEAGRAPGGYLASFRRRGATFDACVDSVGSVYEADGSPGLLGSALEAAGVLGEVEWVELDPIRLQRFPGFDLAIPRGLAALKRALSELCPAEAGALGDALDAMASVHARTRRQLGLSTSVAPAAGFRDEPFGDFLGRFRLSGKARAALGSYATFLGVAPSSASARALSDLWLSYVEGGAWRVRGGFGRLVEALVRRFEREGGTLACGARVGGVEPTGGGVRLSGSFGRLEARQVVWAGAPLCAEGGLSSSFALLYAVVRGVPEGWLPSSGIFPADGRDWIGRGAARWGGAGGLSFPAPGEDRSADGSTPLVLHWPVALEERGAPGKEEVAQALRAVLGRVVPPERVVWWETATPATLQRYTANPGGAAYGWEQSPEAIRGPAAEPSPGAGAPLVRAGHWAGLGGGVLPAAVSGWRAARRLLRADPDPP